MRELNQYFRLLAAAGCEILVVDGSPPPVFAENGAVLSRASRHLPVDPRFGFLNDKVNGVHTGVRAASCEKIVLADDDIRYDLCSLGAIVDRLDHADVVRPQNYLYPQPWWARIEAARMLINRATLKAADYPGTCAFGRTTMMRVGHYDGDVLFDNEELIRHFATRGAVIHYAPDLFVRKRPPVLRKWLEQRPRQAYEDFGLRAKTSLFFGWPLALLLVGIRFGWAGVGTFLGTVTVASILLALRGWRRGQAREHFPIGVIFFAPIWVIERTFSTFWALGWYVFRGGYPFGGRLLSKGIGRDWHRGGKAAHTNAQTGRSESSGQKSFS